MAAKMVQCAKPRLERLLIAGSGLALALLGCMQAAPPMPPARLIGSERQIAGPSGERAYALVGSPGRPRCQLTAAQIKSLDKPEIATDETAPLTAADGLVTFAMATSKIVPCTVPEFENALRRNPEYRFATLFGCPSSPNYLTCEWESTTSSAGDRWKCLPAPSPTVKQEPVELAQPGCD